MFNFRQVTGQSKFRAWKTWKKGEYVIIKIESFAPNKKNSKYQDIIGKMLDNNFQQTDWNKNDRVALNGTTGTQKFLNAELSNLGEDELKHLVGKVAKIVYMGKEIVKTGEWAGSETHVTECYMADEEGGAAETENDVVAEAQELVKKAKSFL